MVRFEQFSRILKARARAGAFAPFSPVQRALTVLGMTPFALVGCAVHSAEPLGHVPLPSYNVSLPLAVPRVPVGGAASQDAALARPAMTPAVKAPAALEATIGQLTRDFAGVVGVAVTSVDDGWTVSANGELKLPQQSVSKLWVTMTVLDAIDRGQLRLDTPLRITKADFTVFHQPIAALVKDDAGYATTVGEVMRRAMTMSDNTCNDKLLRLVGGPQAVRSFIARKGLGPIRFGPGEKLLQAGTAGLEWKPEYSFGNAFAKARAALPRHVRLAAFEAYVSDPPDGAAPSAIAAALARLSKGELLSRDSTDWLMKTMASSHTGRQRLRGAVPPGWQFGHKTGTGQDLGGRTAGYNDVGVLTAPDGKSYAVAVMIGDTPRPIRERQDLMQAVVASVVANHR